MASRGNGQGQGLTTAEKERGFEAFFRVQLSVVSQIQTKWARARAITYLHFDLNAGSGRNDLAGVAGSPLLFRAIASNFPLRAIQVCVELDEERAAQLAKATECDQDTYVICGDNREVAAAIPHIVDQYDRCSHAFGSILLDPNDQHRDAIPYDELRTVAAACPKLDIAFNFPSLATKRIRCNYEKQGGVKEETVAALVDIEDLPRVLGKRYMQIRRGVGNFHLVIGRNHEVGDYAKEGFVRWESPEGIERRRRAKYSRQELGTAAHNQLPLWQTI